MSDDKESIVKLKKKLNVESKKKKQYQGLFLGSAVVLIVIISLVYNSLVLDYAVIDNVKIQQQINLITFQSGTFNGSLHFDISEFEVRGDLGSKLRSFFYSHPRLMSALHSGKQECSIPTWRAQF